MKSPPSRDIRPRPLTPGPRTVRHTVTLPEVNALSGKCLDIVGKPIVADGSNVQLADCNFGEVISSQRWELMRDGRLMNLRSRNCLSIKGRAPFSNGTHAQLQPCGEECDFRWTLSSQGVLVNACGMCLDMDGELGKEDGAVVQTCEWTNNQRWRFTDGRARSGFLVHTLTEKCLSILGEQYAFGDAKVQLSECEFRNATSIQRWELAADGRLRNVGWSVCLNHKGTPPKPNGTRAQLWFCNRDGYCDFKWTLSARGFLTNACGMCLDVDSDLGEEDGAEVQMWECDYARPDWTNDQRWHFHDEEVTSRDLSGVVGVSLASLVLLCVLLGLGLRCILRRGRSPQTSEDEGDAGDAERGNRSDSKLCLNHTGLTTCRTRTPGDLRSDPRLWGIRVDQLVMFYQRHQEFLEAYCKDHRLDPDGMTHVCVQHPCRWVHGQASHRPGMSDDAELPALLQTMHLIVDLLIKPLTAVDGGALGYAPLFNKHAPLQASIFVSHCWSELFPDFVQTLEKHLPSSAVVWVCSFALPQNGDINQLVSKCELEESPFAQALLNADRVLVVVDERILPLERIWCLYEMYICALHRIHMDVRAPTMSKTLFRDILKKVGQTDICGCKSTNEDDRQRILQAVRGFEHEVNRTIKQSIEDLVRLMESVED